MSSFDEFLRWVNKYLYVCNSLNEGNMKKNNFLLVQDWASKIILLFVLLYILTFTHKHKNISTISFHQKTKPFLPARWVPSTNELQSYKYLLNQSPPMVHILKKLKYLIKNFQYMYHWGRLIMQIFVCL
jgi:hypothetical protein